MGETLTLKISPENILLEYTLNKHTCDMEIGQESLLQKRVIGKSIAEILSYNEEYAEDDFLTLKHLQSLQTALYLLTGEETTLPLLHGQVSKISYDDNMIAILEISEKPLLRETMKNTCSSCSSCSC